MEFEVGQTYVIGKLTFDFLRDVVQHIFAGWLEVAVDYFMAFLFQIFAEFFVWRKCVDQNRVIPNIDNFGLHNFLDVAEIYYHPVFWIIKINDGRSFYRDKKFVRMSVHILAFAVVIVENVGGFEGENFGDANHGAKIKKVGGVRSTKLEVGSTKLKN